MTGKSLKTRTMTRNAFLACTMLLIFVAKAHSQDLYSASVDGLTGNITVSWHDTNPTTALDYVVKWGLSPGVWTGTTIVPIPNSTYLITGINGNNDPYFIQIEKTVAGGTELVANISVIFLNVNHIGVVTFAATIAVLNWNALGAVLAGDFFVERFEAPDWKVLKQVPYVFGTPTYSCNDTISAPFCDYSNVSYRIRFKISTAAFAESLSSIGSNGPFKDNTLPTNTKNDTVSVYSDPSGKYTGSPVLGWGRAPDNDIFGYEIQRSDIPSSGYFPIDTVPAGTTFFIDTAVEACAKSYAYAIVAIDKCGNRSSGTYAIGDRQTITLSLSEINPCQRKANLSWNNYNDMPGGLGGYYIFRKENSGIFTLIFTAGPTATSYSDVFNFKNGSTYTYFVRAFSASGIFSSSSCQKPVTYSGQVNPDTLYITQASVVADSYIKVDYHFAPANTAAKLLLQRSGSAAGPWVPIDSISAPTGNYLQQDYFINDTTADVGSQSYFYRLAVVDSCNAITFYSMNTARSIFLQCQFSDDANTILWNNYDTWMQNVAGYDIYRQVDGQPLGGDLIQTASAVADNFTETSAGFAADAKVCYWVTARENSGNPVANNAVSVSNSCCIIKSYSVYLPTAFSPNGKNNRFRPISNTIEPGSFTMLIFNKWGQQIFETNDLFSGWDGNVNGEIAPFGVYAYLISYQSLSGESYQKRGTVVLVR